MNHGSIVLGLSGELDAEWHAWLLIVMWPASHMNSHCGTAVVVELAWTIDKWWPLLLLKLANVLHCYCRMVTTSITVGHTTALNGNHLNLSPIVVYKLATIPIQMYFLYILITSRKLNLTSCKVKGQDRKIKYIQNI